MEDLSGKGFKKVLLSDFGLPSFGGMEFGWAKEYEFRVTHTDGSDGMESFLRLARRTMQESYEAIKLKAKADENYTLLALMSKIETAG